MSIPVILKTAASPMRIFSAGSKRLNDLNRSAMSLAKEKPVTNNDFLRLFGQRKDLLGKVDRTINQVESIARKATSPKNGYGGSEYVSTVNTLKSGLDKLKGRLS